MENSKVAIDRAKKAKRKASLDNKKAEALKRWRVEDYLDLGEDFNVYICLHGGDVKTGRKSYATATVAKCNAAAGMSLDSATALLARFVAQGAVLTCPRWAAAREADVWAPDACNYSKYDKGATVVGHAQVKLVADGNKHYHLREIQFWTAVSIADEDYVRVTMRLDALPDDWEHRPNYQSDAVDLRRPYGLPHATIATGRGTSDSWRSESIWTSAEDFISEAKRQETQTEI
jgi:hypothetical protein